jgi:hypothetical protein
MVETSFADSKSSAVRDWNEGRCKRAYKSKSLNRTSVVAAFFLEELLSANCRFQSPLVIASSRLCPRVA